MLLNPVIGSPESPKLTIGVLDPVDYEGEINWVQLETPDPSWNLPSGFKGRWLAGPTKSKICVCVRCQ